MTWAPWKCNYCVVRRVGRPWGIRIKTSRAVLALRRVRPSHPFDPSFQLLARLPVASFSPTATAPSASDAVRSFIFADCNFEGDWIHAKGALFTIHTLRSKIDLPKVARTRFSDMPRPWFTQAKSGEQKRALPNHWQNKFGPHSYMYP